MKAPREHDWDAVRRIADAWSADRVDAVSWSPVNRIIAAGWKAQGLDHTRLRTLLGQSRDILKPLDDPFLTDFALHRWLSGSREEAYSDWLAWIVHHVRDPIAVFRLFGLKMPSTASEWRTTSVQRETPIPDGRLDLVLRWQSKAVLVVEVKLTNEDEASVDKQHRYRDWIDNQPEEVKEAVLLVLDAEPGCAVGSFQRVDWRGVCLQIRHLACEDLRRESNPGRVIRAAMYLAFAGAVEQNLLGFAAMSLELMDAGCFLNTLPIYDYVAEFQEGLH